MHPPFIAVDHRITYLSHEERRIFRRSRPESLRFEPSGVVPRALVPGARPLRASSRLQVRLGRFLMDLGRRPAGPDIAS